MAKKEMATLMEIVGVWKMLMEMAHDEDVDEETWLDTAEGIVGELEVKAEGYGQVCMLLEAEAQGEKAKSDYLKSAAKSIDSHYKALQNKADRLKARLMEGMIAMDKDVLNTEHFTIKVMGKGGVQPLIIDKPDAIPESFYKVVYEVDNDKIREFLKDNTCDWCHLAPRGKRLDIK